MTEFQILSPAPTSEGKTEPNDKADPQAENRYAICDKVDRIQGWLEPFAARRSIDILRWQDANGVTGNLMEIGVYCGRYFSVLLHAAMRQGDQVLGIDSFEFSKPERVDMEMRRALGPSAQMHMQLRTCNSNELSPEEVREWIGCPRFVSLDGAHDMETVHGDLDLMAQVIAKDGLVALNDVFNLLSPGVNEAVNRFLSQPRRIVPIAFIANKLFMTHRASADRYRNALEDMIRDGNDDGARAFLTRAEAGRHQVEQPFHGHKVLIA